MGMLEGRKALVFGVANDHSIAWGIAKAFHAQGAIVGFSSAEMLIEKRVKPLAASLGADFVEPCDVQSDADIARVFQCLEGRHATLDILVHASRSPSGRSSRARSWTPRAKGSPLALDISAYSLVAITRAARDRSCPRWQRPDAHLLRRGEGGRELQRHGRRESRAGGRRALPGGGPGAAGHPGQRHQRGTHPDTRSVGGRGTSRSSIASSGTSRPCATPITIEDMGDAALYLCSRACRAR